MKFVILVHSTPQPWGHPTGDFVAAHQALPAQQREQMERDSRKAIEHAVKGMLQDNRLGAAQFRNLYVYAGTEHPHEAQQPTVYELKNL